MESRPSGDQLVERLGQAAPSSGSGTRALTERRASVRLSLASRAALSIRRCTSVGSSPACPAASSWVTTPISPWAMVSWISLAIRCRSSATPASWAWATSRACSPMFSSWASLSSTSAWRRCSLSSEIFSPPTIPKPMATVCTATMIPKNHSSSLVGIGDDDQRIDHHRGGRHPGERHRCRPQQIGVEEPGDDEHEEQGVAHHQQESQHQQPGEVHPHPCLTVSTPSPGVGEHHVHPRRRQRHQPEGDCGRPRGIRVDDGEDGAEGERDVRPPGDHVVEAALPPRHGVGGGVGLSGVDHRAHSQRNRWRRATLPRERTPPGRGD